MVENELISFTESFFKNLGCKIKYDGKVMTIEQAPQNFEELYGKKSPYSIVFSSEDMDEKKELISPGSFLLKSMKDYLENKGQASLIKLEIKPDEEEIKKFFNFKNCKIEKVEKKISYDFIVRFNFLSVFLYLNDKEQSINTIDIYRNEAIKFNLEKYKSSEGKKEDIEVKDIKEFYSKAREKLKNENSQYIEEISLFLEKKLDKEIERIKKHYSNEESEKNIQIARNEEQLKALENSEKFPSDIVKSKIEKLKESIENIKKNFTNKEKEEEFLIADEERKHSLNVSTKLMNTSIIYFPVFTFDVFISNSSAKHFFSLKFNPITREMSTINCDTCKEEVSNIYLCSSGHLSCYSCLKKCESCFNDCCKSCVTNKCDICGKLVCNKCISTCKKCWKKVCKSHLVNIGKNNESCINCSKSCLSCGRFFLKNELKKCLNCSQDICQECKNIYGKFCRNCSSICPMCGNLADKNEFKKCHKCSIQYCAHINKCHKCKKQLCRKFISSS